MVGHTLADCRIFLKLRKPGEGGTPPAHAARGGMGSAESSPIEPTLFMMYKSL